MKIKAHGMMVVAMMMLTACESTVETTWDDVDDIPAPVELQDALIGGEPTRARSEIGRTIIAGGGCTGTLISDRVMVSARHCLQYTTCEDRACVESWGGGVAIFEDAQGQKHTFEVERWTSFDRFGRLEQDFVNRNIDYLDLTRSDYWLSDDVAIIGLAEPVPAWLATPSRLVTDRPETGDPLTVWGYGCTERIVPGTPIKRYRDFTEGVDRSDNLCPGDSGGPVTRGRQGSVQYVNSAFATTGDGVSRDVYGDIMAFEELILAELEAWGEAAPSEPSRPVEPTEPNEPSQPSEPSEPAQPTEPSQPVEPNEPAEPNQPEQPRPLDEDVISEVPGAIRLDDGAGFGLLFDVQATGTYYDLQIDMEVHHPRPEELLLVLSTPDGQRTIIQQRGTNASVYRTYIIPNFDSIPVTGEWVLEFHDTEFGVTGEVRNLKMTWVR